MSPLLEVCNVLNIYHITDTNVISYLALSGSTFLSVAAQFCIFEHTAQLLTR